MKSDYIRRYFTIELYKLNNTLTRQAQNHLDSLSTEKVSLINGWILRYLFNNRDHDVFQKDLENEFCITRSTASKIVRLMEQKGYIVAHSVKEDARLKKLLRTPKSKTLRPVMHDEMEFIENRLLFGFCEEEKAELMAYIDRMKENLER